MQKISFSKYFREKASKFLSKKLILDIDDQGHKFLNKSQPIICLYLEKCMAFALNFVKVAKKAD